MKCFGFRARRIDDISVDYFSLHAPLRHTTLCGGCVRVFVYLSKRGWMAVCAIIFVVYVCYMWQMMKGREKVKPGSDA